MKKDFSHKFHGSTTIGERGQIVIPSEAREAMGLKKGDKLLVFSMGSDMLSLSKLSNLEKFASHLSEKLQKLQHILKTNSDGNSEINSNK